ncbi:MAG TPA: twin-arginine translocation signal domain-containing protein, partial [Verrucomicrobiae bacterium]|nr:twin-arginine translocation signal domain-containing protein [Verrucomicrobiae bacterium]
SQYGNPFMAENVASLTRRQFLRHTGAGLGALTLGAAEVPKAREAVSSPFRQRGYYITFMRMPTYGLVAWKQILDAIQADGGNLLILWMGGGFRSRKFPITWKFNREHENIRHDFGRELVDAAQQRNIKVLLGFTPFGYDGVNQYSLERPELRAKKKDGQPTDEFGIYCWGWNLCPSRPESQRFMTEYVREMAFEFYPEADGLFVESSDYAICECADCRGKFFDREFEFVERISQEMWARNRDATVVVYPHYFSGSKVPGFEVAAATKPFDPRWGLCFTPHSAHLDAKLIQQARLSLWSDDSPALRDPAAIQRNAQRAQQAGVTGYVPSLEAFTYVPTHAEEGQTYLVGQRQIPLGFGWLNPGQIPYEELPIKVNRVAYREFSREPGLSFEAFKLRLGSSIFGSASSGEAVEDLLQLQRWLFQGRTWCQASPLTSPDRMRAMKGQGKLTPEKVLEYRLGLEEMKRMSDRHAASQNAGSRELHRILQWILARWKGINADLLR